MPIFTASLTAITAIGEAQQAYACSDPSGVSRATLGGLIVAIAMIGFGFVMVFVVDAEFAGCGWCGLPVPPRSAVLCAQCGLWCHSRACATVCNHCGWFHCWHHRFGHECNLQNAPDEPEDNDEDDPVNEEDIPPPAQAVGIG